MVDMARDLGDHRAIRALVDAVPGETTALADFALVVAESFAAVSAAPNVDPAERAVAARFLAEALVRVNEPERAVVAAAQAAALFGELLVEQPELYAEQVDAIITAADALLLMGQYEDSLDRLQQAAELLSPHIGEHVAETAVVLDRTAAVLSSLGQSERALECANTVIELSAEHPELRAQWSGALAVRGGLLWEQERFTEAVTDFAAAERLRRELVADNPDGNANRWIHERLKLAHSLAGIGRATEGLGMSSEALADTHALVARYGDRFLLLLADAHSAHAVVLNRLRRNEEAETHYTTAIETYRVVADERPELCLHLLASTLYNRAWVRRDRPAFAVADDEEAADLLRKLADRRPDAHIPTLVMTLMDQWNGLSAQHLDEEALVVAQEASDWCARIPRDPPLHLQAVILKPLHGLTSTLGALDRHHESVTVGTQAARLARRVLSHREDPHLPAIAAELPNLADLLHLLGKSLASLGRHRRAVRVFSEAVGIYRAQARHDAGSVVLQQANLDNDLAVSLSELGRLDRALTVARRAERTYRPLGDHEPMARVGLALCMGNIAAFALEGGNLPEAVTAAQAAVNIARSTPEAGLPTALVNLACVLGTHDLPATVTALIEALELADELDDPELREWALSELWEHPTADTRPLWTKRSTKPYPEPP
jgi:tetratricopeptide (TPR) repeat protein